MYSNRISLGIGAIAIVLAMSACQKNDAPKTASQSQSKVLSAAGFRQEISMASPLTVMKPGQVVTAAVTITNTSSENWSAVGASPVHLSYHWLDRSEKVVVWDGERTGLPMDLNAGGSVNLQAIIKSPDQPGDYILRMTMIQENVAWFDEQGAKALNLPVSVR